MRSGLDLFILTQGYYFELLQNNFRLFYLAGPHDYTMPKFTESERNVLKSRIQNLSSKMRKSKRNRSKDYKFTKNSFKIDTNPLTYDQNFTGAHHSHTSSKKISRKLMRQDSSNEAYFGVESHHTKQQNFKNSRNTKFSHNLSRGDLISWKK